ncbi:MAG TPA: hypothetical protein VLX29_08945 [Nitrospirota bacterium]|nr:hypothetical protein [Nitrospirota bacterium]
MIQITKVLNVERGKREDQGTTAENPFSMEFENTSGELNHVWSCKFIPAVCKNADSDGGATFTSNYSA